MVTGAQELELKVELEEPFGVVSSVSYDKSFIREGRSQDQQFQRLQGPVSLS